LRDKHFSYREQTAHAEKPEATEPISATGPNSVLYQQLGKPVAPPANLDAAYTKEGLIQGMQTAAQNAGISLVKLEIDDSEFPYLVGVVIATQEDMEKFKEQIRKMAAYHFAGGMGGTTYVMNLVPSRAFPPGIGDRIYLRMIPREGILYDALRAEKPAESEPISSTRSNKILYKYLGNPVAPPADLEDAYTKEGLTQGMQTAAQNAGISLEKLEIDDSEFPYLVGAVFANSRNNSKECRLTLFPEGWTMTRCTRSM